MNLQPLGDRLIVEVLDEEELTVSGIVLPDTAREKPQRGRVLAVGPGARDEDGKYVEMDVAEGDEIVFSKYGGTEINGYRRLCRGRCRERIRFRSTSGGRRPLLRRERPAPDDSRGRRIRPGVVHEPR